ncbi:hypothetical protein EGR95_13265 [bacterium]|nr:hypothetical protein [bacterium]
MDQKLAVLFMPDDMTLTKEKTPLMLRPILFCPILTWMVEELMGRGIERFFIVSDKRAHDMMRPYVPENADVVYVDGARHGEELLTLLKDEKGSVLIVNGAVLPVGVFSGGDSLSIELKKKFDKFLYDHKASIQVREGYGTTETVTACCLTPPHMFKEGSIGLPFPDTYIKIVEPDTDREVPYGQEGEILLAGPTVMKEYMNNPEETAQTLRTHADGLTWVYTGDLGMMDEQGFVYFRGRAKRMIISSGYNVYPGQIENILDAHEYVQMSCVIGVPDPYKMQKVKAFVKLAAGVPATEETKQVLLAYCRKNVAKYAMPYDIEFKEDMPKTLVGKVAYRQLEEEELAKIKAAEEK